jgi:hypothetical protein
VTYEALLHISEIQFKTGLESFRFFVVTGKDIQTYLMFERITDHVASVRYRSGEVAGKAFGQFTGHAGQLQGGAASEVGAEGAAFSEVISARRKKVPVVDNVGDPQFVKGVDQDYIIGFPVVPVIQELNTITTAHGDVIRLR